jgi:hypothetical protein
MESLRCTPARIKLVWPRNQHQAPCLRTARPGTSPNCFVRVCSRTYPCGCAADASHAGAPQIVKHPSFKGEVRVIDFSSITSMYGSVHCASQVVKRVPRRFIAGAHVPAQANGNA